MQNSMNTRSLPFEHTIILMLPDFPGSQQKARTFVITLVVFLVPVFILWQIFIPYMFWTLCISFGWGHSFWRLQFSHILNLEALCVSYKTCPFTVLLWLGMVNSWQMRIALSMTPGDYSTGQLYLFMFLFCFGLSLFFCYYFDLKFWATSSWGWTNFFIKCWYRFTINFSIDEVCQLFC
jgi:hypothetical protein